MADPTKPTLEVTVDPSLATHLVETWGDGGAIASRIDGEWTKDSDPELVAIIEQGDEARKGE